MTEYMVIKVVADTLTQNVIWLSYLSIGCSLTAIGISIGMLASTFKRRRGPYKKRTKDSFFAQKFEPWESGWGTGDDKKESND